MLLLSHFKIHGHSMEPTLLLGQEVLVSSIPYLFLKPKVGDIIVIKIGRESRHSGKRGTSASRIRSISRKTERFWSRSAPHRLVQGSAPQNDGGDVYLVKRIVKTDREKYFVRGDNKRDSLDSRRLGWIERKEIAGKVILKISNLKNQMSNLHLKSQNLRTKRFKI